MGGPATKRTISQEAFDEIVKENIEDYEMEPAEAVQDAIDSLTLQGVDLSGIITCIPGESSVEDNPVMKSIDDLMKFLDEFEERELQNLTPLLRNLANLCDPNDSKDKDSNANAAIAARNGGVELVTSICEKVSGSGNEEVVVAALLALTSLLRDVQTAQTFHKCGGPDIVIGILNQDAQSSEILNACFSVIAASATENEILKEAFVNLKIDQVMVNTLKGDNKGSFPSMYDSIRVLLTPDDFRVAASQVYRYARQFAKAGIAEALVDALQEGLTSPTLVSASVALKAVAVNDEICRSIADRGGIDAVLRCIDDSGEQLNKSVARSCCILLTKLAGSDYNKSAIVEKRGLDRLISLCGRFADEPTVIQEVMYIISVLSLRSPDHASRAIEAGAGDLAIQAMQRFPYAQQLQRYACIMIRNLVVRNPENRKILLDNGIEKIIRKGKENHQSCNAAATDALRDLGLDNYNL
ncbi:armadillo repeat-containing protein 6-like [Chenopodium quinoa]|uniref:armadillo repeat-containing protein 6-like n=1 Tax=Chenopodium quinoa TaxID=63459 RepID=UPI000B77A1F4|nr:armadillo repeat-containing protein 6-like [Chenopodium quinoa]